MSENILLTGDTGGLGFIIATKLIQNGYSVIGLSSGKKINLIKELTELANAHSVSYQNIPTDLSSPSSIHAHLESSVPLQPQEISHVICTHAQNFNEPIENLSWDKILLSLNINFGSSLMISQYYYKTWVKHPVKFDRSIQYISSVASKGGAPQEIAYHSAKRAMESAMLSFYRDGADKGIRANVISPGLMDTDMGKETLKNRPDVIKRVPLQKLTSVEEVAKGSLYFLESQTITGQNLHINAGRHPTI